MAADQRRKRLNGASVAGCSSLKQYRMKKRKLESPQKGLSSKSHISLEWDRNQKKVVAKKEQIGISRRNLRPFIDSAPGSHNVLADVFAIPQETFELENLSEVLSYEVWQTQLSEDERNFLMQFLPRGQNAEQVVQALLAGDNFHFENPFLKWGASLCSGDLHPDAVVHQEQCLKAEKKAYYSELQKYHNDIIKYLQKLKDRWESCKDPEKEILPKIGRTRRDAEKRISSNTSETRLHDREQDVTATSESCSWAADEKASSSDNQNSSVMKGGEIQKRMYEKGFMKDKSRNSLIASDDVLNVGAKPKKGDKLNKRNIHHCDGAKYMSYFKISKKQHQLVKNMKQSGKSIQSKSLNRVLGNLDGLHVQPYEVFVEEEKKKLHEHWLQLANEDLPAFYTNWKERKLQMREIIQSLGQEMKDKLKFFIEDEEEENPIVQDEEEENPVVQDEEEENPVAQDEEEENPVVEDEEEENPVVEDEEEENHFIEDEEEERVVEDEEEENRVVEDEEEENRVVEDEEEENRVVEDEEEENPVVQDEEEENPVFQDEEEEYQGASLDQRDEVAVNHESNIEDDEDSVPGSPEDQSTQQITSPSGSHEFDHVDMGHENNNVTSKSDSSSDVTGHFQKMNTADDTVNEEVPLPSGGDVWPTISRPHSYFDSTANHEFTASGLPLMNPQINEDQQTHLIDLESNLRAEDMGKDLLHRQSDDSLNSYQNQDRNELLQSLFKGQGMLPFHQEQKHAGLNFQPPNNLLMAGDGQFPGHFQEQLETSLPLEPGQKRLSDLFMHQNLSENLYSDRGRYLIPRQENLQPGNMHNWTVNPVRMSEPLESHINGGELLNQNWFSSEQQVRGGWIGSDGVSIQSQSIGNGSNADQSLFSVLSNCSQLRSVNPYDSISSTEQFMASRNYGLMAGVAPGISNTLPHTAHPLDYLGGRDAPTSVMPDDMGWINLPHQNPALHDQMGKPYLRSWNQ